MLDASECWRCDRPAEGLDGAVARIVDDDEEHVRSPLGRLGARDHQPVRHGFPQRPPGNAAEGAIRDRQRRAVLVELAHRLGKRVLQGRAALLVGLDDGLRRRTRQRLFDRETLVGIEHRDDRRGTGLHRLAELVVETLLHLVVGDPAEDRAGCRADHYRCEHRRCREADEETDAATPLGARTPEVVAGLLDGDLAVGIVGHEDHGLELDLLRPDALDEGVEVTVGRFDARVPGDQDIGQFVSHGGLLVRER